MQENIYDHPIFFEKYSEMLRSKQGLQGAGEWPTLKQILPDFKGKNVLDLGCGYGWHCIYAAQQGAQSVLGIDLSEKMINEAKRRNSSPCITYQVMGIEDFEYPSNSFDIVICSLALHYIENLSYIYSRVYQTLTDQGIFIFTIEHPIFTAHGSQKWIVDEQNQPLHWPIDQYFIEGKRKTHFLGEEVIKYHHTLTSILQTLLKTGFILTDIIEPQPTSEMLHNIPDMKEELRRPMMLIVAATKNIIQRKG